MRGFFIGVFVGMLLLKIFLWGLAFTNSLSTTLPTVPELNEEGKVVKIPQKVYDDLNERFVGSKTEYLLCLQGVERFDSFTIYGVVKEKTSVSTETSATTFYPYACEGVDNTIGTLHNHPKGTCNPSLTDIFTFGSLRNQINGIQCGQDTIAFYDMPDHDERPEWSRLPIKVI